MSDEHVAGAQEFIALNQDDEQQLTDTGMGHRFVDTVGRVTRYAVDIGRWYTWEEQRWAKDSKQSLRAFALTQAAIRSMRETVLNWDDENGGRQQGLRTVNTFESEKKRRAILGVASADPRIQVSEEDFDQSINEIVTPSGVVDLDTGEIRPGRPEDMNSRCTTVPYDPNARSGLLDNFLKTFLPDEEDQAFVFAVLGHALRVGNRSRTLPIFWGDTTSGKSQLFAALHKVLGSYICTVGSSVFRGNLDDKPRPDLVNAMFTRIAYATEASKAWALHADQVKRLTGGDVLPYRDLFEGVVNKLPRFTPMIVTNVMPRISNADGPTKRRILVMHFDKSLSSTVENPKYKEEFLASEECLRAILARLVDGARSRMLDDPTKIPTKYVMATMNARGDVDHTDEFLEWMTDEGYLLEAPEGTPASSCVTTGYIHSFYSHWLKKYGDDVDRKDALSAKGLNASLKEKGWQSTRSAGTRWVGKQLTPNVPTWIALTG